MNNSNKSDGKFSPPANIEVKSVHGDLSQEVITITVDKLSLILFQHASSIEDKKSWIAPFGVLLTIILTLITTTFKDYILSQSTWYAIFIISLILVILWFLRSLYRSIWSPSIEDLVEKIKQQK